ncbi:uncharacterized protein PHACADRAFT_246540 [Phanerochaete carnosa HHB-10118-sp]|uniref:Uncharacterized protein n=1 Tax=Phanerochaete carnosa (strain HHB-10118-sp) TaxID=650164 RepID=K5XC21_PHACS|nr:uncharacterized protein PHACADRAFT_246540 [Phanerochaete carnosa HHB-10118-sp]EKM60537.1 hypothetical protein PHACADRAFT_246540 [Phanerochaete carnosa HHB-10118-sp]
MAVLAPQDWHPPRDLQMDAPSNAINTAVPRQRSSPANDHSATSSPVSQQPYPYPVQQQQAGWTAPHPHQQYYPSFYQNHHQQPYQLHGHPAQGQMHFQNPYYDPANAQLAAQWAYQQMVQNAHHQAHQMSHVPPPHPGQRSRTGSASAGDYFVPSPMTGYSPFPSGTPPAHPSQLPNSYSSGQSDHGGHQNQYNGFHPYRRPDRQDSRHRDAPQPSPGADWRGPGPFQPPYIRADAAGSSTSVNSTGSNSGGTRQRTNSIQGSSASPSTNGRSPVPNGRSPSGNPSSSGSAPQPRPHQRTTSSSSNSSTGTSRPPAASSSATTSAQLRKPSPLSQGNYTAAEKRMSRDDSDLAAMMAEPAPGVRSGGLKGRLRRALSLNAGSTLREEDEDEAHKHAKNGKTSAGDGASTVAGDDDSTATVQKKKSRSLFNSRLNRSTDNISLSSTMSSASMVIRKLGNIGKLTRRNSLAGITSLFKEKDKKEKDGEDVGKKSKKSKDSKSNASEPAVSHATAELDVGEWSADLSGLSPAARLARQHTLKTNAEAAAKAKAEAEAKAKALAAATQAQSSSNPHVPTTWEKNTTSRNGETAPSKVLTGVSDDGTRVLVEDDDTDSDDGQYDHPPYNHEGWEEDDDDWEGLQDEEATIRQGLEDARLEDNDDMEPWALGVRRSAERSRRPAKSILKNGRDYDQETHVATHPPFGRVRSNSYDSPPHLNPDLGPLARIPSPDPDHIDGLHKHHLSSGPSSGPSFIPPLPFEKDMPKGDNSAPRSSTPEKTLFSHPNSSAPALSTMFQSNAPTLTHRSATAPAKRLAFASNLSVYDTFPSSVYDRRSEPATWSRLTPALAQRIKEELNSYKMEEMEVHAASRVHTQFFV